MSTDLRPPANVTAFRAKRVVITVKRNSRRRKVFQIIFGRDGSVFVNFPYFRHRTGVLAAATIPGNGQTTSQVDLTIGGRIASHLVKYAHHRDGRAHFSQDGQVRTEVRRQSISLEHQNGHLFSVLIQGIDGCDEADVRKDAGVTKERTTLNFEVPENERVDALKFVGRWYAISALKMSGEGAETVGPQVSTQLSNGRVQNSVLLANPAEHTKHVLMLTCEVIPALTADPEVLVFSGGFDAPEVMNDVNRDAGFLGFLYPAADADELKRRIGTIDFVPETRREP